SGRRILSASGIAVLRTDSAVFVASCMFNSDTETPNVQHGCLRPEVSDLQQGGGEQPCTWQVLLWCDCSCTHSSCVLQQNQLESVDLVHISPCFNIYYKWEKKYRENSNHAFSFVSWAWLWIL
uniref:Uncharacterized protein n=1 Tax=Coturnix japonica TaxID=93934 RepID=A0A8C2SSE0_COTJA